MRDLKYLQYFEDLLQQANNALVTQAREDGKVCVAYTCENVPEPLLNLDRAVSIRLSAPNTGSIDIATYYMTNLLCEPSRALLERAIEGGFNFADCVITPDGCTMMNRCVENMELLKTMGKDNPNFFHEYMEIAFKNTEEDVDLAVLQCTNHVLT
ncbi:MAG TPA: 2-hydroxyacyl-CoA dehydratase, partial [Clostridiales bacterium]|nr:2-hydroxyacyl-CoA dehydratase [Clostridiales bacterium]